MDEFAELNLQESERWMEQLNSDPFHPLKIMEKYQQMPLTCSEGASFISQIIPVYELKHKEVRTYWKIFQQLSQQFLLTLDPQKEEFILARIFSVRDKLDKSMNELHKILHQLKETQQLHSSNNHDNGSKCHKMEVDEVENIQTQLGAMDITT